VETAVFGRASQINWSNTRGWIWKGHTKNKHEPLSSTSNEKFQAKLRIKDPDADPSGVNLFLTAPVSNSENRTWEKIIFSFVCSKNNCLTDLAQLDSSASFSAFK